MKTFVDLCRDLFFLSQWDIDGHGPARGHQWEQRVAEYLAHHGLPVEALPGAFMVLGHASLSGLPHQIDGTIGCTDALVIGEWKAHQGSIPKNELLRFKAATDDYFMALGSAGPRRPVMRVFGGTGGASDELRAYGVLHGITLIEPTRWPAPVLASDDLLWQDQHSVGPSPSDRKIPAQGGPPILCHPLSSDFIVYLLALPQDSSFWPIASANHLLRSATFVYRSKMRFLSHQSTRSLPVSWAFATSSSASLSTRRERLI